MAFSGVNTTNRKILDALGIASDTVTAVDIHLRVPDLPVVVVTHRLFDKDADAFAEVVRTFTFYEQIEEETG